MTTYNDLGTTQTDFKLEWDEVQVTETLQILFEKEFSVFPHF